jgi:ABC-type sugar transport system substrate-binding protein
LVRFAGAVGTGVCCLKDVDAMKAVALLLDDPQNRYQQLLAREAKAAASRHGVTLLEPQFAAGSSWTQAESVNAYLRQESRPDAMLVMLAGGQLARAHFERVVKAGLATVFLNRIPAWSEDLRKAFPDTLVCGVAPRQEGVGELQARQAKHIAPPGSFVILVTGEAASATAVERRRGFLGTVKDAFAVHELDGRWSAAGAEKALGDWFRLGAERDRRVDLVVGQNDAMAAGARRALAAQAARTGRPDIERVPLIGCDGLPDEGQAMVARGELAATVVVPPTTPAALDILSRHWTGGARSETVLLDAESHPPLETIGRR